MSRLQLKQGRGLPPFCRLPEEILEEIVSELDHRRDLVALALTSRICAATVIPRHTQYRILRIHRTLPEVWAHLARRADLARNMREVHIFEPTNLLAADHYPTTLIDKGLDLIPDYAEESARIRNLCKALNHMHRLHTFVWSWKGVQGQQRPTSHPAHENSILTVLTRLPRLQHVSLNGKFAVHALTSYRDINSSTYPAWKLANLHSLSISGDTWAKLGNSKHIWKLLTQSPNLEYLEVPLEFHHLAECTLPKLKHLKLVLQGGAVSLGMDRSQALFLQNHPTLEVLEWFPFSVPHISPDVLPNLRSLRSNKQFITALNCSDFSSQAVHSLMTPPSTPLTVTIPVPPESPVPSPPIISRKIENLDIFSMDACTLLDLKILDPSSLRRLNIHSFGDIDVLQEIAEAFPNIEWLSLPPVHLPSGSVHPIPVSKEEWLDILPRFPKLETFRGLGLWCSVKDDKQAMHENILALVQTCPNLRVLDRVDRHGGLDPLKEIVITREGEFQEHINYGISQKPLRKPFDVMEGVFD